MPPPHIVYKYIFLVELPKTHNANINIISNLVKFCSAFLSTFYSYPLPRFILAIFRAFTCCDVVHFPFYAVERVAHCVDCAVICLVADGCQQVIEYGHLLFVKLFNLLFLGHDSDL